MMRVPCGRRSRPPRRCLGAQWPQRQAPPLVTMTLSFLRTSLTLLSSAPWPLPRRCFLLRRHVQPSLLSRPRRRPRVSLGPKWSPRRCPTRRARPTRPPSRPRPLLPPSDFCRRRRAPESLVAAVRPLRMPLGPRVAQGRLQVLKLLPWRRRWHAARLPAPAFSPSRRTSRRRRRPRRRQGGARRLSPVQMRASPLQCRVAWQIGRAHV